ncbi:RNA polymerase sigma factor [Sphingomonas sp. DT-51]|uniref:RNA polymerase sigma factor n=1 Tax=Sphingomonas sp. DT-51 TaxID=3396165 RepID=UPI003F1C5621
MAGWRDSAATLTPIEPPIGLELPDAALERALRAFVAGRVRQPADRDDIVQETYARLFGYQTMREVGDVKALCFAIARNLLLDHHRSMRRGTSVELDEELVCPLPSAERIVAFRRAVAVLADALERMPPLRREIFLRKRVDGLTTADIAGALEMSLAAVEKHVVRAFADLRAALARRGVTLADGA